MGIIVTTESIIELGGRAAKKSIAEAVANFITGYGDKYNLDTVQRVSHFCGQVSVESQGYSRLEENLNYSAKRLRAVWPSRFPNMDVANQYDHNPKALANMVYGSRMGNRPGTDDGWNFRGSSVKMITGGYNFQKCSEYVSTEVSSAPNFYESPDEMRKEEWAIWPAIWYWTSHDCYKYADNNDVTGLTKVINGGTIGIQDRKTETYQALSIFKKLNENQEMPPHPETIKPDGPDNMVATYQRELSILAEIDGIPEYQLDDDGWYGPMTRKAIRLFQFNHKVELTGSFDPTTTALLDTIIASENG
jgi:putative chitinase